LTSLAAVPFISFVLAFFIFTRLQKPLTASGAGEGRVWYGGEGPCLSFARTDAGATPACALQGGGGGAGQAYSTQQVLDLMAKLLTYAHWVGENILQWLPHYPIPNSVTASTNPRMIESSFLERRGVYCDIVFKKLLKKSFVRLWGNFNFMVTENAIQDGNS
jgi:hypothetical protein